MYQCMVDIFCCFENEIVCQVSVVGLCVFLDCEEDGGGEQGFEDDGEEDGGVEVGCVVEDGGFDGVEFGDFGVFVVGFLLGGCFMFGYGEGFCGL